MHTVLRTIAGRVLISSAIAAGGVGILLAPAWASSQPAAKHSAPVHHDAQAQLGSNDVEIGTAVAYVREPDGTIRRVR